MRARDALADGAGALGLVHQKADGAVIEAIDRQCAVMVEQVVQHLEHETVAAEHYQCFRLVGAHPIMGIRKRGGGLLGAGVIGGDKG